jgi:uncharacterized protein YigA (DUF484 family)
LELAVALAQEKVEVLEEEMELAKDMGWANMSAQVSAHMLGRDLEKEWALYLAFVKEKEWVHQLGLESGAKWEPMLEHKLESAMGVARAWTWE